MPRPHALRWGCPAAEGSAVAPGYANVYAQPAEAWREWTMASQVQPADLSRTLPSYAPQAFVAAAVRAPSPQPACALRCAAWSPQVSHRSVRPCEGKPPYVSFDGSSASTSIPAMATRSHSPLMGGSMMSHVSSPMPSYVPACASTAVAGWGGPPFDGAGSGGLSWVAPAASPSPCAGGRSISPTRSVLVSAWGCDASTGMATQETGYHSFESVCYGTPLAGTRGSTSFVVSARRNVYAEVRPATPADFQQDAWDGGLAALSLDASGYGPSSGRAVGVPAGPAPTRHSRWARQSDVLGASRDASPARRCGPGAGWEARAPTGVSLGWGSWGDCAHGARQGDGTFADDVYIATRCPSPDRRGHPVDLPSAAGLASATTFAQPTPTYDGGAALWQNRMPNRWGLTRPHLYERPMLA